MDEKIWDFNMSKITPESVKDVFEELYKRWRISNSDTVTIDGEKKGKYHVFCEPCKVTVCDTQNGFALKEEMFVIEQIKQYEQKYKDTVGSAINRITHLRIGIYLDYLKLKESGDTVDYKSLASYLASGNFVDSITADVLKSIIKTKSADPKPNWIGTGQSAWDFKDRFWPDDNAESFNHCFNFRKKNGGVRGIKTGDKNKEGMKSPLCKELKKY